VLQQPARFRGGCIPNNTGRANLDDVIPRAVVRAEEPAVVLAFTCYSTLIEYNASIVQAGDSVASAGEVSGALSGARARERLNL